MSCIPTLRLNLQTFEVQFQLVTDGSCRRTLRHRSLITQHTALVFSIKACFINIGIVAATHYLVVDNHLILEIDCNLSIY